jgi:hypothetical protein
MVALFPPSCTSLSLIMPINRVIFIFVLTIFMCVASGVIADPADIV